MRRFLILLLVLVSSMTVVFSYGRSDHDNILKEVLFGSVSCSVSPMGQRNLTLINDASYLAIDFFNGREKNTGNLTDKGKEAEEMLGKLSQAGVRNIPQTIDEIDYNEGPRHRRYTHVGWEPIYVVSKGNWPVRKNILLNTVDSVCEFKGNEKIKVEAFAAIVYYVHLLGDFKHKGGETGVTKLRSDVLPMTSENGYLHNESTENRKNNPTIYTELLFYISRLFREQQQDSNYEQLCDFLEKNKDRFCTITNPSKTMSSAVIDFATQTIAELSTYLPPLLQGERFFCDTFLK